MKNENLKIKLRIPKVLHDMMLTDLRRPHHFAFERVGFMYSTSTMVDFETVIITVNEYLPVADDHYIEDDDVGAKINSNAIRMAMQQCIDHDRGCFHVHLHDHRGKPFPSKTDNIGLPGIVESLCNITGDQINGLLILSKDSFYAAVKLNGEHHLVEPEVVSVVGYPMLFKFAKPFEPLLSEVFDRQSFLGNKSKNYFDNLQIGIVGLGGGGSHIAQQLAHIGVRNISIFDDDIIEASNLNRLVGGYHNDIKKGEAKTAIATRLISNILPNANVIEIKLKWQEKAEELQKCDIVFGCVDTFLSRQQLEAECRRYLIPYIDIGMDVYKNGIDEYYMSGQIILSMPGMPGMKNMGFLTEEKLAAEAAKYGNVGGRPQVVWPNGVLASSAIGVFIDLVTGWTGQSNKLIYLSYDGNLGTVNPHLRLNFLDIEQSEYDIKDTGKARFKKL